MEVGTPDHAPKQLQVVVTAWTPTRPKRGGVHWIVRARDDGAWHREALTALGR